MKVYKGNLPDFTNYADFLEEFKIEQGLIITDKGFPFDNKDNTFKEGKVGYIRPLKRNSKTAIKLDRFSKLTLINSVEGKLLGAKESDIDKDNETRYYYWFQDLRRKAKEDNDYIKRVEKRTILI